jgi:ferredoxin
MPIEWSTEQASTQGADYILLEREHFPQLIEALRAQGYQVVGPTVRDGAIVYDELSSAANLPVGWGDKQESGSYRLEKGNAVALFGYRLGPHSWKKFFHPPVARLWRAAHNTKGWQINSTTSSAPKLALIGVRACEMHAIAIRDKVFLGGQYVDPVYEARRKDTFIIAVNCGQAGGTCFCASMRTGPKATFGFDLALTELIENGRHCFVVEVGTETGAALLQHVPHCAAPTADREKAEQLLVQTAGQMGRSLDTDGLKELLYRNFENPHWDDVASRCLTCGNCTMVCPTCFCTTVEETTDLTGEQVERWRNWDSCFTLDFSYIHGGSVRASSKARYRQWLTHKLATWFDQFGTSGCVGCGRCISWCPVGIDITEETRAIRQSDGASLSKEIRDANP